MKKFFLAAAFIAGTLSTQAQKFFTKNGNISFNSKTAIENIAATSNQVTAVIVPATGDMQFSVLVTTFHFEKALMEEHFNETYMESNKYPKASFKGKIDDISKVNFTKDGTYAITVTGDMTMHNVTKKTTTPGSVTIKAGKISAAAQFIVKLADYKIDVPKVVRNNISETVTIKVACNYDQKM
jgi:polyisoprenoid-binding protein YceI